MKKEINMENLDMAIRCAMCTNAMKNDNGCDGSCVVDMDMYKRVIAAVEESIVTNHGSIENEEKLRFGDCVHSRYGIPLQKHVPPMPKKRRNHENN